METYEAILGRRSVRSFRADPVPEEIIDRLMRAGMGGPSASNQWPLQFMVLTDREKLGQLATIRGYEIVERAPLVVLVCGDMEKNRLGVIWVMDGSIAAQNILLAAHDAGLGAVWLGCWPAPERMPDTHRVLGLPWQIVPFAVLAMGYADHAPAPADRFEPERVHLNSW